VILLRGAIICFCAQILLFYSINFDLFFLHKALFFEKPFYKNFVFLLHTKQKRIKFANKLKKSAMVKVTKSIELTLSDILTAIDLMPAKDRKAILNHLIDEKTGIKLLRYQDMPNSTDLEAMMKAQGYKGVNWQEVDRLVAELDIQEPIEELLRQLTK
jgi:hypothetical protein